MKLLSPAEWSSYEGTFIALWTDATHAYALYEPGELVAVALLEGAYPALPYPGADWFQRLAKDLNGHIAVGFQPTGTAIEQFRAPDGRAAWPEFTGPEAEGVHQVAIGPVYGDITEPAHYRVFVLGERILKLHVRLGYAHRGVLGLMRGKSPRQAARYAARLAGDSTVAHSIAFARAAEIACGAQVPERAYVLRAIMAEIERLSNHCGDLGAIARLTESALLESRLLLMREQLAHAAQEAFGHRLMMDMVIPGGVAANMGESGNAVLHRVLAMVEGELPDLRLAFDESTVLHERLVGVGIIPLDLAVAYNAGGSVGRGSGRAVDARRLPGYPPYQSMAFGIPMEKSGDVAARTRIRLSEIAESVGLIRAFLEGLPEGALAVTLPVENGMGLGVAESFRGPVWHWLKIDNGHIQDAFVADASTAHWKLLEHAAITSDLVDFALLECSVAASVAGVDG